MGLFNGYMKEGKGVSKEQAEDRKYFEIFFGRFWDLVKLNLLYALCNIPMIAGAVLLAIPLWFDNSNIDMYIKAIASGNILVVFWLILPLAPFILSGPFTAGLTYVTRNYSDREHAFLVSDFFEHTKKNIKQGLLMNLVSFVVFFLYITAAIFYYISSGASLVIGILLLIPGVVLASARFYTFPMIISFNMKIIDIIKNSVIFAMIKLPQNFFILAIVVVMHGLLLYFGGVWLITMPLILISWTSFTINYYAWHVIKKFMKKDDDKNDDGIQPVFEDTIIKR